MALAMTRVSLWSLAVLSLFTLHIFHSVQPAEAGECAKTCVELTREGGELVITARRDPIRVKPSAPSATPTPTPSATAPRKVSGTPTRRPVARTSLSDQIREVLPEAAFTTRPRVGPLIHEPVLIRTSGCAPIAKSLPILDTRIELRLTPQSQWEWGDSAREAWPTGVRDGAHIYHRAGRYKITMRCLWLGTFRTPDTTWAPIPEGLISSYSQIVEVFRARVFFTQ